MQANLKFLNMAFKRYLLGLLNLMPNFIVKKIMVKRFGHIGFELSNLCNANCTFCAYRFQKREKGKIKSELFDKVLGEYVTSNGGNISFSPTVGDPLVDKNIVDKINRAADFKEIKQIALYTNGILLKKIGFQNLLTSGLTQLSISTFIGSKEGYLKYYGVNKYDLVMSNILEISKLNAQMGFPVNITLHLRVDLDQQAWRNSPIFKEIKKYIKNKNISFLTEYDNWSGKIFETDLPLGAKIETPIDIKEKSKSPCFEMYRRMHIYSDGNVGCCVCRDIEGEINIGNVQDQTITEIWNGKKLSNYRENWISSGEMPNVCKGCTRYKSIDSFIRKNKKTILVNFLKRTY